MIFGQAAPLMSPDEISPGEQAAHVVELSRALARRGHEVRIYARREQPARKGAQPVRIGDGVTVEHLTAGPEKPLSADELLPHMGDFGRALAARWDDGPFQPDVIHAHFWMSGLAALTATTESRFPVVVTYHALGSVERRHQPERASTGKPRVGLERTLGTMADRVIAQTEEEVVELGRMGVPRGDIVVVPSGVDPDQFTPTGPAVTRGVMPRVLSVGRLDERKGFADLIATLPRVPDAELVIVGGPPAEELDRDPAAKRLRELAERLGVADRLRLVGRVARADMPSWYRSADVVACTPVYGFAPLVPIEAMSCGVPVVAYEGGGIGESVIDGVTGILVPTREVRDLASALRALLRDNVRRMSLSSAAVDRVRSRYTWDRVAFDTERVYADVRGEKPIDEAEASDASDSEDEVFSSSS
jgi:D-inositol-3-phosphate glycosyltransferase